MKIRSPSTPTTTSEPGRTPRRSRAQAGRVIWPFEETVTVEITPEP